MFKNLPILLLAIFAINFTVAQQDNTWTAIANSKDIKVAPTAQRNSFPQSFTLFKGNTEAIRTALADAPQRFTQKAGKIIVLPNAEGTTERFEMLEASNFEPGLQAQFPSIRSYVGKGIDDKKAILRLSIDSRGIQAMIFRTDKKNEFIEPYSEDGTIYAVFNSEREKGSLPFNCSTAESTISNQLAPQNRSAQSNSGELLTFRLALSCNAEYTAYFGGTKAGALAAFNATMTRVNGVFEKDFAIHMNLVENSLDIIYTNPATDPYSNNMNQWNNQVQNTVTSVIGEANYDIGHMFGSNGGGGNAGCIGCVCVNNQKGSGITSPNDGVPMGDTFDIDYVAHEMGHQFGATHTFSNYSEGSGTNVEPGSGSTIMGYAGITDQNIQLHSDDYFVFASIKQVQDNMVSKTCPVRTPLENAAPSAEAGINYTIPKSTPFILTGSGADADGDNLTYCWEQNDSATSEVGNSSQAFATKDSGPNWRSYNPVSEPTRFFPPLARVVVNQLTTSFGSIKSEAVSSVGRELNFVLTARENVDGVGQTAADAMLVTVTAEAGPFLVTSPNTNVALQAGSNQDVTWNVAGTTENGVDAESVDIYLSTNGGVSFPILLASNVPNDGSETVTLPSAAGTLNRIMVRGHDHIFYDISNTNFSISSPSAGFAVAFNGIAGQQNKTACQGTAIDYTFLYEAIGGFSANTTFSVAGFPAGSTATFSSNTMSQSGTGTLSITNTEASNPGLYLITVTATSGGMTKFVPFYLELFSSTFADVALLTPANNATAQSISPTLSWTASSNATLYNVELATDESFVNIVSSASVDTNSYTPAELSEGTDYFWRVLPRNQSCEGIYSASGKFQTGLVVCDGSSLEDIGLTISTQANVTVESELEIAANAVISGVTVSVDVTHSWINDLTVTLISPAGTEILLVAEPCSYDPINDITATFSDTGAVAVCGDNPGISGTVQPLNPLSALYGENSAGTWTLRVNDGYQFDGGVFNGWSLDICSTQALAVSQNSIEGFVIYPNPNNGSFNVQMSSESSDDIKINVNDMRGRQIYSRSYQNSGLFNENIQLSNVEAGIYLVTVQSGSKREVKKIIVN
jgi:subtilisin-like proprotein convertase family protein